MRCVFSHVAPRSWLPRKLHTSQIGHPCFSRTSGVGVFFSRLKPRTNPLPVTCLPRFRYRVAQGFVHDSCITPGIQGHPIPKANRTSCELMRRFARDVTGVPCKQITIELRCSKANDEAQFNRSTHNIIVEYRNDVLSERRQWESTRTNIAGSTCSWNLHCSHIGTAQFT